MKFFKLLLALLAFTLSLQSTAQLPSLSSHSDISILTVGPGQDLYSIFGHTGVRVKDDSTGMDVVFNYGTFEFGDDFYFLFCMGKLNYKLATEPFEYFKGSYVWENRWVKEQVLNLNQSQRQKLFNALMLNYQPENKYYLYDFFYDNCSTRPRVLIESTLNDVLTINYKEEKKDSSFRDMIDAYLVQQSWGDIGIDLALGLPCDVLATPKLKTFLPDYLYNSFSISTITVNGKQKNLVKEVNSIVTARPTASQFDFTKPYMILMYVVLLYLLFGSLKFPIASIGLKILDSIVFSLTGIAGWIILFLWFVTDHNTTQNNFNILWGVPLLFPFALSIWLKVLPLWVQTGFKYLFYLCALLLVVWAVIPQKMNPFFLFWVLLLMQRYSSYAGIWKNSKFEHFNLFYLQKR